MCSAVVVDGELEDERKGQHEGGHERLDRKDKGRNIEDDATDEEPQAFAHFETVEQLQHRQRDVFGNELAEKQARYLKKSTTDSNDSNASAVTMLSMVGPHHHELCERYQMLNSVRTLPSAFEVAFPTPRVYHPFTSTNTPKRPYQATESTVTKYAQQSSEALSLALILISSAKL